MSKDHATIATFSKSVEVLVIRILYPAICDMVARMLVVELHDDKHGDKQLLSFRIESKTEIHPFIVKEKREDTFGKHRKNPQTLQPYPMRRLLWGSRRG